MHPRACLRRSFVGFALIQLVICSRLVQPMASDYDDWVSWPYATSLIFYCWIVGFSFVTEKYRKKDWRFATCTKRFLHMDELGWQANMFLLLAASNLPFCFTKIFSINLHESQVLSEFNPSSYIR